MSVYKLMSRRLWELEELADVLRRALPELERCQDWPEREQWLLFAQLFEADDAAQA